MVRSAKQWADQCKTQLKEKDSELTLIDLSIMTCLVVSAIRKRPRDEYFVIKMRRVRNCKFINYCIM